MTVLKTANRMLCQTLAMDRYRRTGQLPELGDALGGALEFLVHGVELETAERLLRRLHIHLVDITEQSLGIGEFMIVPIPCTQEEWEALAQDERARWRQSHAFHASDPTLVARCLLRKRKNLRWAERRQLTKTGLENLENSILIWASMRGFMLDERASHAMRQALRRTMRELRDACPMLQQR